MQRDFDKAHAVASKKGGAQQAGHHGEEIWATFLREWLPPQYAVGTRKYLLLEDVPEGCSDVSAETDIVIFHPSYPPKLREKTEVLASGVAAAFSAKLTLDRAAIDEAIKEAAKVRRATKLRSHDLNGKILSPFIYGILSHTHTWTSPSSKPIEIVTSAAINLDSLYSKSPREGIDLLCISDLNCWSKMIMIMTPRDAQNLPTSVVAPDGHIQYSFLNIGDDNTAKDASNLVLPPVAFLIGLLYEKMSYYDDSLSALADGFRVTGTGPFELSSVSNTGNRLFKPSSLLRPDDLAAFNSGFLLRRAYW